MNIIKRIDNLLKEEAETEYQKFFKGMLKKFGVKSPAELSTEKKKEFFAEIEKKWTKDEGKPDNDKDEE